jgi:glycosyltransferase involved in cell wall biosynthesis
MRVLIVSSYPPRHCGIGAYARDQVDRLRDQGHQVTVLTAEDGDGDLTASLLGGSAFFKAAMAGGRFDRIVVHFQPALYYRPRRPLSKVGTSLALLFLSLVRGTKLEVIVHEADPPIRWRPDYVLLRWALRGAARISFHTQAERDDFERRYRIRLRSGVIPHAVRAAGGVGRGEARRRLGIEPIEGLLFVCAGFLQPSKGFDRAVEAFAAARTGGDRLFVVGSVREPTPENLAYAGALSDRGRSVPGVAVIERFVSDADFDLWVAAADRIVLPYRRSWSSGILARAHAVGTPAIVSGVGGLAEQASEHDVVVHDDAELVRAMAAVPAAAPGG